MRKKDTLYVANKWNQQMFNSPNIYAFGGSDWEALAAADKAAHPELYADGLDTLTQYKNQKNFLGISKANNPFSKGNIGGTLSSVGTAAAQVGGSLASKAIANGYESSAGSTVGTIASAGLGALGTTIGGPLGGAVGSAVGQILGGVTSRLTGIKANTENINAIKANTGEAIKNGNIIGNAQTNEDILNNASNMTTSNNFSSTDLYKGGAWAKGKARRKAKKLLTANNQALDYQNHALNTAVANVAQNNKDLVNANFSAFGGGLDNMDALNYDYMSDLLGIKNKKAYSDMGDVSMLPNTVFALGGDIQTHGGDFTTGAMHIDAGGTHEENPNGGVGINRDSEGNPNLVEEGEVVFNNYVFSNRISVNDEVKQMFHLGKKKDYTYADIAKKLESEASERPNDPISKKGLNSNMQRLADFQEQQKEDMQIQKAQEEFASLPKEQQVALMEQIQQQQQNNNSDAQETQIPQENMGIQNVQNLQDTQEYTEDNTPQMSPEEQQILQQQMMQQGMSAYGGPLETANYFDDGGETNKKKIISDILGFNTYGEFEDYAKRKKINLDNIDWDNIASNTAFLNAISEDNPELKFLRSNGYDYGLNSYSFNPTSSIKSNRQKVNWDNTTAASWQGDEDAAWLEALQKHNGFIDPKTDRQTLEKIISETDAYKRGTQWLKDNEENRRLYLVDTLNSPSKAARDHALQFINEDGSWKNGASRDYETIFGTVRSTYPGDYWRTPKEVSRKKVTKNFFRDANGKITEAFNIDPTWSQSRSANWQDPLNDYTYNFYTSPPEAAVVDALKEDPKKISSKRTPKTYNDKLRYLGALGPMVGFGLQEAGIGKPDTNGLMALAEAYQNGPMYIPSPKYIGNYLKYEPADIWNISNANIATKNATDRAIRNNASPIGTQMAGLLANSYNSQLANGDMLIKAKQANDALNAKTQEFNRGTDQFNAQAWNAMAAQNAQLINNHSNTATQLLMDAYKTKLGLDTSWEAAKYANLGKMFEALSDIGRENAYYNKASKMAADGIAGVLGNSYTGEDYLEDIYTPKSKRAKSSKTTR